MLLLSKYVSKKKKLKMSMPICLLDGIHIVIKCLSVSLQVLYLQTKTFIQFMSNKFGRSPSARVSVSTYTIPLTFSKPDSQQNTNLFSS